LTEEELAHRLIIVSFEFAGLLGMTDRTGSSDLNDLLPSFTLEVSQMHATSSVPQPSLNAVSMKAFALSKRSCFRFWIVLLRCLAALSLFEPPCLEL